MNPVPIQPIYKPPIPTAPVISPGPTTGTSTLGYPLDKTMSLINNTTNTISSSINNLSKNVSENINQFSNAASVNADASSSYLSSNTLIAKFAFLILVIIVFLFLLNLGIMLIQYFYSPSEDPYLIKGMVSGTEPVTIHQDPNNSDSILINRSNNESTGLEFTWSVWLHINELEDQQRVYQHVFNKGDTSFSSNGITNINNGPGLYLINNKSSMNVGSAELRVVMDSNNKSDNNYIDIKEVPIKKWVHVAIRMQNTVMDVYVNGIIAGRLTMTDVPKQNYNNVNVNQEGGFKGKLSNLRYYSRALNVFEINNVVSTGPNLETYLPVESPKYYGYLSQLWYSSKV
jgi:hypothetical protein